MRHREGNHQGLCSAVLVLATIFFFLCPGVSCLPAGASDPVPGPGGASPSGVPVPGGVSSSHWRSFIWDALPPEWLSGNDRNVILEAYQARDWKPFFFSSRFEPTSGANELIRRIEASEAEGIDPKPYRIDEVRKRLDNLAGLRTSLSALDPDFADTRAVFSDKPSFENPPPAPAPQPSGRGTAAASTTESAQATDREKELKYRDVFREAGEIDIELATRLVKFSRELNPFAGDLIIEGLQGETPMAEFMGKLEPASPHYKPLIEALARYRKLSQTPLIPYKDKVPVKPGEHGNHVSVLQNRLQQEAFYQGKITGSFDRETQEAVREFQRVHLLLADGTVGQRTKDWLNVPYGQKAEMIARSLKITRESQVRPFEHGKFVRINIPEFILEYYRDGAIAEVHRIIVGRASGKQVKVNGRMVGENQTPTLASNIEQIVINPRWYVSDRIGLELNSEAGNDPQYWARHGYVQMASKYPWGQPRIFQMPGPGNALGHVKFEFHNPYAIYLHDTPRRSLFQNARRDYSHGCIRVDKAEGLARTLLTDEQNAAAQKIPNYLENKNPSFIRLSQPVPIVIEYAPASSGENGQVLFPGDPYGLLDLQTKG